MNAHRPDAASDPVPSPRPDWVPVDDDDRAAFGEFLRTLRERRQLTVDEIASDTKIAPHHFASLERGDVQSWPRGMYRRAMMRAYAESIGLDREFALQQFERVFDPPQQRAEVTSEAPPSPQPRGRMVLPRRLVLPSRLVLPRRLGLPRRLALPRRPVLAAAALLVLVAIALAAMWGGSDQRAPEVHAEEVASPPPAVAPEPALPPPAPAPAPPAVATSGTAARPPEPNTPAATEARLVVVSQPPGARVTVNGIGWGDTPLTIRHLPFGEKRVRLTKDGYLSQERAVRVGPDRPTAQVRVSLRPRP